MFESFDLYIFIWILYGFVVDHLNIFVFVFVLFFLTWLLFSCVKTYDPALLPKAFKVVQTFFHKNQIKIFVFSICVTLYFLSNSLTLCECIIGLMVMYYLFRFCIFLRKNNINVLASYFIFSFIYRLNNDELTVSYAVFWLVVVHLYYLFAELNPNLKFKRLILDFKVHQDYVAAHLLVECFYFSVLEDVSVVGILLVSFYPEFIVCLPEHFVFIMKAFFKAGFILCMVVRMIIIVFFNPPGPEKCEFSALMFCFTCIGTIIAFSSHSKDLHDKATSGGTNHPGDSSSVEKIQDRDLGFVARNGTDVDNGKRFKWVNDGENPPFKKNGTHPKEIDGDATYRLILSETDPIKRAKYESTGFKYPKDAPGSVNITVQTTKKLVFVKGLGYVTAEVPQAYINGQPVPSKKINKYKPFFKAEDFDWVKPEEGKKK